MFSLFFGFCFVVIFGEMLVLTNCPLKFGTRFIPMRVRRPEHMFRRSLTAYANACLYSVVHTLECAYGDIQVNGVRLLVVSNKVSDLNWMLWESVFLSLLIFSVHFVFFCPPLCCRSFAFGKTRTQYSSMRHTDTTPVHPEVSTLKSEPTKHKHQLEIIYWIQSTKKKRVLLGLLKMCKSI